MVIFVCDDHEQSMTFEPMESATDLNVCRTFTPCKLENELNGIEGARLRQDIQT